ncbi:MAG: hypothetical protein PWP62_2385 [Eubacteriaceae bacterium]|nr:hypothetical protein [Eubacteriaceae bacterium]MDK2961221.1 hypothetical protein [Eubacteriaceae bacterium]
MIFAAVTAFNSVQFFEGAVAAIALYISTKPTVRKPRTPKN